MALPDPSVGENRTLGVVPAGLAGALVSLGLLSAKAAERFLYHRWPSARVFAFT